MLESFNVRKCPSHGWMAETRIHLDDSRVLDIDVSKGPWGGLRVSARGARLVDGVRRSIFGGAGSDYRHYAPIQDSPSRVTRKAVESAFQTHALPMVGSLTAAARAHYAAMTESGRC